MNPPKDDPNLNSEKRFTQVERQYQSIPQHVYYPTNIHPNYSLQRNGNFPISQVKLNEGVELPVGRTQTVHPSNIEANLQNSSHSSTNQLSNQKKNQIYLLSTIFISKERLILLS